MSTDKLLPGNETVLLVPVVEINGIPMLVGPTGLVLWSAPTTACLALWQGISTGAAAGAGAGGNISRAIKDDMKLSLLDSDTDKDRAITSVGQALSLTAFKFDATLTIFRDVSITSTDSTFNMANDLVRAPDVPYMIAHRIGYAEGTAPAIGQEWDYYYVWTDNPTPVYSDGGNQANSINFIAKNVVLIANALIV